VAPDVDIYAANVYRGDYGFGAFWDQVRVATDRPAFITEYGAPAYSKQVSLKESEDITLPVGNIKIILTLNSPEVLDLLTL